jgi:hypothetical protein
MFFAGVFGRNSKGSGFFAKHETKINLLPDNRKIKEELC